MKYTEKLQAIELRKSGSSIKEIAQTLNVSKSSVSLWVRDISLSAEQRNELSTRPFTTAAIEKRRLSRLKNEKAKRDTIEISAEKDITAITPRELWLMGVMLYWAEGGKTRRMVRFSNGDPEMISIMMRFFRIICEVPEKKFRGYIHIHPHLDHNKAEDYWVRVTGIPSGQFFKTYRKVNVSSQNKKNSLPHGVMDIYVMDSNLFLKIRGWSKGIFKQSQT